MIYTADFLIERRKEKWYQDNDIERDKIFRETIVEELRVNEQLRNEIKLNPEKLIELTFIIVNKENATSIAFEYNAKNGYGAYGGKEVVEIFLSEYSDPIYMDQEDFEEKGTTNSIEIYNIIQRVKELSAQTDYRADDAQEILSHYDNVFEVYDGEEVAKILGVEYYES